MKIMDTEAIRRALMRIAHEILERNRGVGDLVIIGIRAKGDLLAARIATVINELEKTTVPVGVLDITLYRDDFTMLEQSPVVHETQIPFDITDKHIVLIDDVLYTGRTTRCALDALVDLGRPAQIQLGVLIDRGHRELPVKADYVGKNVPTARDQIVEVHLSEVSGQSDEVIITEREEKNTERRG